MTFRRYAKRSIIVVSGLVVVAVIGFRQRTHQTHSAFSQAHGHHGGHTIKLPGDGDIELELTVDQRQRRMVIYFQASKTHEPVPLPTKTLDAEFVTDQVFEAVFTADPRPTDAEGISSRFMVRLDQLPQQLLAFNEFLLRISWWANGERIEVELTHTNDHVHDYHHD
ncbi:MAG: hypothetical protein AAGG48_21390 [Planctomycetota bacterium]